MSEANEHNQKIIDEFRANAGKVGGRFEGRTLLLLHNKGAKSGQARINPVAYVKDGAGSSSLHPKVVRRPIRIGITTCLLTRT